MLLLSACISPEARLRALEHGANGVLQKPFPLRELERLALGSAGRTDAA